MVSTKSFIKSLAAAALCAATALIAGCGGGGATDPFAVPPTAVTPPLVVNPGALNAYPGVPVVLTISSGVGPFQVFSSDSTVLPVTQAVAGAAVTMVANAIDGLDRIVTVTVRDSAGQSTAVSITVKPSPLLGSLAITSVSNTQCPGLTGNTGTGSGTAAIGPRASICTGETAVAQIVLRGANTSPVANRQIRFDVLQGAYNFALDQNGTTLVKAATILTDQNGSAIVTIRADATVATQIALIRATDTLSGNRVDTWFTIVQSTAGVASFQVSPVKASITGYYVNTCGAGSTSYQIYGGTAPYSVFANSVSTVVLEVGSTRGQTVVVPSSGGSFAAIALGSACTGTSTTLFTITDATGRVITATFDSIAGTVALPVAPTPDTLIVTPPDAQIVCRAGAVVVFTLSGGTSPYLVATDRPYVPPLVAESSPSNGTTVTGSNVRLNQAFAAGTIINVAISDAKSKVATAKITCTP